MLCLMVGSGLIASQQHYSLSEGHEFASSVGLLLATLKPS
jgi:hypothetical protein